MRRFSGNITLSFGSGFSITITEDQWIYPEIGVDPNGALTANMSTREMLISPPDKFDLNAQITLGYPFFEASYMLVNYDQQPPMFSIWKANANASSELIALDTEGYACGPPSLATSAPNNSSSGGSSNSSSGVTDFPSATFPAGGIAGIVIGFVVVFAAMGGLWWWLAKRRHTHIQNEIDSTHVEPPHSRLRYTKKKPVSITEMESTAVGEMDAATRPPTIPQLYSTSSER